MKIFESLNCFARQGRRSRLTDEECIMRPISVEVVSKQRRRSCSARVIKARVPRVQSESRTSSVNKPSTPATSSVTWRVGDHVARVTSPSDQWSSAYFEFGPRHSTPIPSADINDTRFICYNETRVTRNNDEDTTLQGPKYSTPNSSFNEENDHPTLKRFEYLINGKRVSNSRKSDQSNDAITSKSVRKSLKRKSAALKFADDYTPTPVVQSKRRKIEPTKTEEVPKRATMPVHSVREPNVRVTLSDDAPSLCGPKHSTPVSSVNHYTDYTLMPYDLGLYDGIYVTSSIYDKSTKQIEPVKIVTPLKGNLGKLKNNPKLVKNMMKERSFKLPIIRNKVVPSSSAKKDRILSDKENKPKQLKTTIIQTTNNIIPISGSISLPKAHNKQQSEVAFSTLLNEEKPVSYLEYGPRHSTPMTSFTSVSALIVNITSDGRGSNAPTTVPCFSERKDARHAPSSNDTGISSTADDNIIYVDSMHYDTIYRRLVKHSAVEVWPLNGKSCMLHQPRGQGDYPDITAGHASTSGSEYPAESSTSSRTSSSDISYLSLLDDMVVLGATYTVKRWCHLADGVCDTSVVTSPFQHSQDMVIYTPRSNDRVSEILDSIEQCIVLLK